MEYCTIGVFAHANAGKTTVTENILYHTGIINKIGRVDSGTTITDNLEVERNRGITIRSSFVTFTVNNLSIQLLDTPGHIDFSAEVVRAMQTLDAAVFVISGVEGIEAQTINIWNMLNTLHVPTLFFINKLDRIGANYNKVVESLRRTFTDKIVELEDITIDDNYCIDIRPKGSIDILEQLSAFDEESLDYYFMNEDNIQKTWIDNKLCKLYSENKVYCVLGGSALSEIGVYQLLEAIIKYLPRYQVTTNNAFAGKVYMVKRNNGLRETYIKVLQGVLENRMEVPIDGNPQKIRTLYGMDGNTKIACDYAMPGQLVIATGLECESGQFIGETDNIEEQQISLSPMFTSIISIDGKHEKIALWTALRELTEEDPLLNARLDAESKKVQVDLMGRLQGETVIQMLFERYALTASISDPTIIYKETPIEEGIGKAGYTKTSNVALKIEPLERGAGIHFQTLLASDYLFTKYQKQVERLIYRYSSIGLFGWEITDCMISLIGGKCDNVGSEPQDYNICTPIALSRALKQCETKLLEPVVAYSIICPNENYSEIIAKLMAMRKGYSEVAEKDNSTYEIKGEAFLSEIEQFTNVFREITGGKGSVNYSLIGYDDAITTCNITREVTDNNPHNESKFVLNMNGIMDNLDKGLETKRGKPEKIKRNKHLWKKQ